MSYKYNKSIRTVNNSKTKHRICNYPLLAGLKKYTFLLTAILLLLTIGLAHAQIDNRSILLNQARRMEARRDFDSALDLYRELIKSYPADEEIADGYFTVLVTVNKYDEAEELLNNYSQAFSPEKTVFHRITLYGRQGEMRQARRVGLEYLRANPGVVNLYHEFALAYERIAQFETAVEVLLLCRRQTGDEYIFAIDMARNRQASNNYREAVREYVKHLERNTGFLYMVADRINGMIDEDSSLNAVVTGLLSGTEENILLELYAMILNHSGQYEKAYEIYGRLGPEKLIAYADELTAASMYELAVRAYEEFYDTVTDPVQRAEVKVKIASIYINGRKYEEAEQTLLELTYDDKLKDRQHRFRTHVNRIIREMLADVAVRRDKPKKEIVRWLEEAKTYAFNQNEQREIDLKKVRYLIMAEDYDDAAATIEETIGAQPSGSRIYHISFYYRFLLDLMVTETPADSLLAELIISVPGDEITNEALLLAVISNHISPANRSSFLQAYRLKSLYKEEEALHTILRPVSAGLDSLYSQAQEQGERYPDITSLTTLIDTLFQKEMSGLDEEVILIAAQWAADIDLLDLSSALYSYPFENDAIAGFAALKKSEMLKDKKQPYRESVTSFLNSNPQNVLAPQLRLLITD